MMTAKTYDLAEIIKAEREKTEPVIIKVGELSIALDPPVLWPDAVYEIDDIAGAKMLLGDDYDAFCAAGGTSKMLFYAIVPELFGANLPESDASTDS